MSESRSQNSFNHFSRSKYKGENMIAIVSQNHGSGKTWMSISLAQILSSMHKKILLFDGASGINNIKNQLGLNALPDLDKVIYGTSSLNQIISSYNKGHFDIILNNHDSANLSTMSIGSMQIFGEDLNIIAQNYDNVILDLDVNINKTSNVLAEMAKNIIIICNDNIASIADSYELIRQFHQRAPHSQISIIINQSNNYTEGQRAYNSLLQACKTYMDLSLPLLGIIREDTRVRDSIRSQSTIINRYPYSEAAIDLINIAKRIEEK
jgi:flagellar biosynthesis protein FlhG